MVVRQTAFELFEIPSGSMRPTFKEYDRLVVSKSQFSINLPFTLSHFLFNEDRLKRMGIVIFTGQNLDIENVKVNYFYLFPGYKQFVKRMIAKPGDHVYFYGGRVFGIDKNGNDISKEMQLESLSDLEHIPFITIYGRSDLSNDEVVLSQMNIPLVSYKKDGLSATSNLIQNKELESLWGLSNYAHAILKHENESYFLEITHHPKLSDPELGFDMLFNKQPFPKVEKSYIKLEDRHLERLWNNLYTCRFVVKGGYYSRYGRDFRSNLLSPKLKQGVPDGIYEFDKGRPIEIGMQGSHTYLSPPHPLSKMDKKRLYTLFNLGIECDNRFLPNSGYKQLLPSRYCYFRDGGLYVMGTLLMTKEDPNLLAFIEMEKDKSISSSGYIPFIDEGKPTLKDGSIDVEKLLSKGLEITNGYLVLGDNHAMSGDSREFGFVPQENIRGIPSFLFWAPGGRVGTTDVGIYPWLTTPKILVWSVISTLSLIAYMRHRKNQKLPIDID